MEEKYHRNASRAHYHLNKEQYRKRHTIRRTKSRELFRFIKNKKGCFVCGCNGEAVLDFHHISGKDLNIGDMASMSLKRIEEEIKKCIILCSNCHRTVHYYNEEIAVDLNTYWHEFIFELPSWWNWKTR